MYSKTTVFLVTWSGKTLTGTHWGDVELNRAVRNVSGNPVPPLHCHLVQCNTATPETRRREPLALRVRSYQIWIKQMLQDLWRPNRVKETTFTVVSYVSCIISRHLKLYLIYILVRFFLKLKKVFNGRPNNWRSQRNGPNNGCKRTLLNRSCTEVNRYNNYWQCKWDLTPNQSCDCGVDVQIWSN